MADESPRVWLTRRYLPLAWMSLGATVLIHFGVGGPVEFTADLFFLLINLVGLLLHRRGSRHTVALHMLALFALILWYSAAPGGIPDLLGTQVVLFAAILLLPNIILVSLYGIRAALVSTLLGLFGIVVLGPTPAELATGAFLVAVSSLIGGVFFHRLIVTLEETQRALARAAFIDPMTGIGNRRAFAADFGRIVDPGWMLTLWDVDGLKKINDRYGHAAGDHYLLEFVRSLRAACGPEDRVYRVGGDEFAGLHSPGDAASLAEAVRRRFPSVSVGGVRVGMRTLNQAMVEADGLLYEDKARRTRAQSPRLVIDLSSAVSPSRS